MSACKDCLHMIGGFYWGGDTIAPNVCGALAGYIHASGRVFTERRHA